MTRLTIDEDPGDEFAVRGFNTVTHSNDNGIIFYEDVGKVHVLPEHDSFTIQVVTPDLTVEMDFADAEDVRKALALFETKKVLEADSETPFSVRMTPVPETQKKRDSSASGTQIEAEHHRAGRSRQAP
jgi:hypothetical protein